MKSKKRNSAKSNENRENGTAMIIAVMIMGLLAIFTAASLSRVSNEAILMGNDYAMSQTFYASLASLEKVSRNFGIEVQQSPKLTSADLAAVAAKNPNDTNDDGVVDGSDVPPFEGFTFNQQITQTAAQQTYTISDNTSDLDGLYSLRDAWRVDATATGRGGVEVKLSRTFYNHLIPIFQFGIFYEGDLTIMPSPEMYIGGRVHTNGNLYVGGRIGTYFESRVTAVNHIARDVQPSGLAPFDSQKKVFFTTDGGTTFVEINKTSVTGGPDVNVAGLEKPDNEDEPQVPDGTKDATWWSTYQDSFNGWVKAHATTLNLNVTIGDNKERDTVEIIKRGRSDDNPVLASGRFFFKSCIRVSLDDSQSRLPGGSGGVRLDGYWKGDQAGEGDNKSKDKLPLAGSPTTAATGRRGYQPLAMTDGYQAMRLNGHRLWTDESYTAGGMPAKRETWIKVERITYNANDPDSPTSVVDITKDILSLGVTESAPMPTDGAAQAANYIWVGDGSWNDTAGNPNVVKSAMSGTTLTADPSRAILRLQRLRIDGPPLKVEDIMVNAASAATFTTLTQLDGAVKGVPKKDERPAFNTGAINLYTHVVGPATTPTVPAPLAYNCVTNRDAHFDKEELDYPVGTTKLLNINNDAARTDVVPVPIEMYDVREGLYYNSVHVAEWNARYKFTATSTPSTMSTTSNSNIPYTGIMSMIDVNMANLTRLINGDFDGKFPVNTNLGSDIRANCNFQERGFIVYISDRRGDADGDGMYDMENTYVATSKTDSAPATASPTDGLQPGEDTQGKGSGGVTPDGLPQVDYTWESARYYDSPLTINTTIPTDLAAVFDHKQFRRGVRLVNGQKLNNTYLTETQGLTIATENGVYIKGNFNAESADTPPGGGKPTPPSGYNGDQIPAAIIGDAVTMLSREWNDGKSFRRPLFFANQSEQSGSEPSIDEKFSTTVTAATDYSSRIMNSVAGMETTVRAAMMTGNAKNSVYNASLPSGGGLTRNQDGGAHNYPRFLESWSYSGQARTNICGSLICLWNSRNNTGSFKFSMRTYNAPARNWTFDTSFQDVERLPPGTPMLQFVQMTGFRQALR